MVFLSICTALFDYAPQGENELEITEGELLYILEKSTDDDWWKAKKRALNEDDEEPMGLIPNNYVEEARPTHRAKALYDYSRQTDEELSFSEDAVLDVYDNKTDPDWTLVGLDGEYGFAPANYIEITSEADGMTDEAATTASSTQHETGPAHSSAPARATAGPAAAIAGIMHQKTSSTNSASAPVQPVRHAQFTPETSDEEAPPPSLPQRPRSEQISPPPKTQESSRPPESPGMLETPPNNRSVKQTHDDNSRDPKAGGFHLYNINEMVSTMGKSKKLPTTLGINLATGKIMLAPEKSRDGPQQEWTADKLTHYSIESKHVFIELVRPSKSVDLHAGQKDTAKEIVSALGEIAGTVRAGGLREVLEAAGTGTQKKGQMLYDFVAQGDDEVTVVIDDAVIVLDDTKSEEWWMVRRLKNGKEGVVPSSYVELTGTIPAPSTNAARNVVEQNRLEEERLAKEAVRSDNKSSEVGPQIRLPDRGSSLASTDDNKASQKGKKDKSHGKSTSTSKSKPDTTKLRTWTDRSGAFKVEAQFIGLKDSKIHLHKLNGVKIAVPVGKMAVEDLEYVEAVTGQSLDDEKPLADVKRRTTQRQRGEQNGPKAGATIEKPSNGQKEGPEYDWFDFFLKAGVSPYQCERYAFNFSKDSMDENILSDITPSVLRTLGLKEGDILRVMKYLDVKFGRTGKDRVASPDEATGGLFSGPGGTLRNNTRKGRPAPPVQSDNMIDENAFKPKDANGERQGTPLGPPPPKKDGFEDDAWDVKPSRKQSASDNLTPVSPRKPSSPPPPQPVMSANLLDLSSLQAPLQPSPAPTATQSTMQPTQTQAQQQQLQPQATGANPAFFQQLGQSQNQNAQGNSGAQFSQAPSQQHNQQVAPPRQRPQAPLVPQQQGALMPPPPTRPFSAPQTQLPNNNFSLPPLQPQLTGFQPQIAPPGQSLNELAQQQNFQQQQFLQQQRQQALLPQQTGFMSQQSPTFNQFQPQNALVPQPPGYNLQAQNPYVNGQQVGSPFADPRLQMQAQATGYQTGFQSQPLQPQATGFPAQYMQPQQTGSINSVLPPALQPQNTGINMNGNSSYTRPGFGQPPPVPPIPSMPTAQPLQPQKTGPAPPVRFGAPAANKLQPQPTGRRANLGNATAANPFGF